ncbi:MAG TPA: Uma2 family endonuclease [Rugosimonospora sp.]|jgi:Uma2 family endonuclease
MTALMPERPPVDLPDAVVLTPQEYEALPPNNRIELVDGVVQVMTPATRRHQEVVDALKAALKKVCPRHLVTVREQEVRLADSTRRNPDVMIVRAAADDLDAYSYEPSDVILAVEVVSPGTQTIDRLHKPAEYAAAKIDHYWYLEISPQIVVHTYRLGETGRYLESGLFKEGDQVAAPGLMWARLPVSDLMP